MRLPIGLIVAASICGCSGPESAAERPAVPSGSAAPAAVGEQLSPAAPWYSRTVALDLTEDGNVDSVRLEARGQRPDSLKISLVLLVNGKPSHESTWGSDYELALVDSATRHRDGLEAILRVKLDSVLASVRVRPIGAPGGELMLEDSTMLKGLEPRPTQVISFSYGYESTERMVWDAPRQRFVQLWSCC